jgi:hypothetical protein
MNALGRVLSILATLPMVGCELLQDNQQRDVVTVIKLDATDTACTLYMEKHLATDSSALESSLAERDARFEIRGRKEELKEINDLGQLPENPEKPPYPTPP